MAKIRPFQNDTLGVYMYVFFCPGCGYDHPFGVKQYLHEGTNPVWEFNGDVDKPTFKPSLLCNKDTPEMRCHLYVTDGKIIFLDDCFHELAGQTVEMTEYES